MCETYKQIEILLKDATGKQAVAIRLMAMMVDKKTSELEKKLVENHRLQMQAIENISTEINKFKGDTSARFQTLEIVTFFSKNRKLFWFLFSCILFLSGAGVENIYKFISTIL